MNLSGPASYAGIMLLAGIGIPILAALNAGLGTRIGSAPAASVIAISVAMTCALITVWGTGMIPRGVSWTGIAPHFYLGGVFMAFYILSITYIAPRFGVGNAVFFVLLGQIISAAVIDHFGLFGAATSRIGTRRLVGMALMAVGVFLARKPPV